MTTAAATIEHSTTFAQLEPGSRSRYLRENMLNLGGAGLPTVQMAVIVPGPSFILEVLVVFPTMLLMWWLAWRAGIKNQWLTGILVVLAGYFARVLVRLAIGLPPFPSRYGP